MPTVVRVSGPIPALRRPGVAAALGAALLFGAGTPLAKALLRDADPWLLAGLLYLGAGAGLLTWRLARRAPRGRLPRADVPWLAGAVVCGGIVAPVLLMAGLTGMPATGASLLLNAEAVFTALIAWFVFRENVDRKVAAGMGAIVAGALSSAGRARGRSSPGVAGGRGAGRMPAVGGGQQPHPPGVVRRRHLAGHGQRAGCGNGQPGTGSGGPRPGACPVRPRWPRR